MSRKVEKVQDTIRHERQKMLDSIAKHCRPLIQVGVLPVQAIKLGLRAILFGNGTYLFDFREGSKYEHHKTPKAFGDLHDMCAELEGCMDDIRPR